MTTTEHLFKLSDKRYDVACTKFDRNVKKGSDQAACIVMHGGIKKNRWLVCCVYGPMFFLSPSTKTWTSVLSVVDIEDFTFSYDEAIELLMSVKTVKEIEKEKSKAKECQQEALKKKEEANCSSDNFGVSWSQHLNGVFVERYGHTKLFSGERVFYANTCFQHESDLLRQQNFYIPQSILDKALKLIVRHRKLASNEFWMRNKITTEEKIIEARIVKINDRFRVQFKSTSDPDDKWSLPF